MDRITLQSKTQKAESAIYLLGKYAQNKGYGSFLQESDRILSALAPIYHAEQAYYFVAPVTRKSVLENRGEGGA